MAGGMTEIDDRRYMAMVAELPCCLCGAWPVEVHHILEGRVKGRRCGNFTVIPLCPDCHRGSFNGVHGQQRMLKIYRTTELELLGETYRKILGRILACSGG